MLGVCPGTYASVVQPEDVAVTVFEGSNQALQVGHVVGELGRGGLLAWVRCLGGGGMESHTLSNTVFISSSVKARILAVVAALLQGLAVR